MKRVQRIAHAMAAVLAALATATADTQAQQAIQPIPDAVLRAGTLRFVAHSTVGDFVGTTASVAGAVVGGADLAAARGWAEAPVATLATGNGWRDRDMRAVMESDRYPTVRLDVHGVRVDAAASADSVGATLRGTLAIHGVMRDVEVPATLVRRGDTVHVTSAFPLRLHDYHIGGLRKLFGALAVRDDVQVGVDLQFVIAPPAASAPLARDAAAPRD